MTTDELMTDSPESIAEPTDARVVLSFVVTQLRQCGVSRFQPLLLNQFRILHVLCLYGGHVNAVFRVREDSRGAPYPAAEQITSARPGGRLLR